MDNLSIESCRIVLCCIALVNKQKLQIKKNKKKEKKKRQIDFSDKTNRKTNFWSNTENVKITVKFKIFELV